MSTNRDLVFANEEYYHIFNRGVEKRQTFTRRKEFIRALDTIHYYRYFNLPMKYSKYINLEKEKKESFLSQLRNFELQVEVVAYCLMPNHFHFLLKQLKEKGITLFISKFTNSYTKYFNTKHDRVGPLFQGVFKAVHVEDDDQFLHLSRYIHLNPVNSFYAKLENLESYEWSSFGEYTGLNVPKIVTTNQLLSFFRNKVEYKRFVLDQADYALKLKRIKHILLK